MIIKHMCYRNWADMPPKAQKEFITRLRERAERPMLHADGSCEIVEYIQQDMDIEFYEEDIYELYQDIFSLENSRRSFWGTYWGAQGWSELDMRNNGRGAYENVEFLDYDVIEKCRRTALGLFAAMLESDSKLGILRSL